MFQLIITLDFELPAGGRGDVRYHMIEPTASLFQICESYRAQLTIMAEIGELWAFEKIENSGYQDYLGYDPAAEMRVQLIEAIRRGHDVQLHLHPQWINARWNDNNWNLDYMHYLLTDFDDEQMINLLHRGRKDFEMLLSPHCQDYECIGFRAGHWNTQPSDRYLKAIRMSGLKSDMSVFKWGYADSVATNFDYRNAFSNVLAWYTRFDDINQSSLDKGILEVPITTERARLVNMLTPKRLWLARKYLLEDRQILKNFRNNNGKKRDIEFLIKRIKNLFRWYPKKLDFCKLTANEMLAMVQNLIKQNKNQKNNLPIPLVMIGHSKYRGAGKELGKFLEGIHEKFGNDIRFTTYRGFIRKYEKFFNMNNYDNNM